MKNLWYIIFLFLAISCTQEKEHTITVASYNLRYDNPEDSVRQNGWQQRCPVIANLILFHDFDIFGTQEGLHHQLEGLKNKLSGYEYIGVGRDDGNQKGEHSAIFYKTGKFELLQKGNFWLAENTDIPNLGWDAACIRICTWGEFREMKTNFKFFFFNLHMDHMGVDARKNSAGLVLDKIKLIAGQSPVILTGDFNVDQHDESYFLFDRSGLLKDAYNQAEIRYDTNGTFNGFDPDAKTDERIDHIFLTKDFAVDRYAVLTDSYRVKLKKDDVSDAEEMIPDVYKAKLPSDHFPVFVKLSY